MKSAWLPLAIVWLAVHAVLLGVILSLKFLGAKTLLIVAMLGAALWFAMGRRPGLSAPRDMV